MFKKVAQWVLTYSCLAVSLMDKRVWQVHAKDINVHVLWYSTTLWQSSSCCLYEKWKFKISSWCISESTQNKHVIVISPKKRIIQFTDTSMTARTVNQIITENTGVIYNCWFLYPQCSFHDIKVIPNHIAVYIQIWVVKFFMGQNSLHQIYGEQYSTKYWNFKAAKNYG